MGSNAPPSCSKLDPTSLASLPSDRFQKDILFYSLLKYGIYGSNGFSPRFSSRSSSMPKRFLLTFAALRDVTNTRVPSDRAFFFPSSPDMKVSSLIKHTAS